MHNKNIYLSPRRDTGKKSYDLISEYKKGPVHKTDIQANKTLKTESYSVKSPEEGSIPGSKGTPELDLKVLECDNLPRKFD